MSHVLHRDMRRVPPIAVGGTGALLRDSTGNTYVDGSSGAAVSCVGHGHPAVLEAMHRQLDRLAYAHTAFFTSESAEELADELVSHAPAKINAAYFVSGGSEAVEAALKMARQYFVEVGQHERRRIIARRLSYHGITLGALSAGSNAPRRRPFEPMLLEGHHVSPCFAYRELERGETPDDYAARLADELEQEILRLGPETVACFIAETVVGATAGAVAAVPGYFRLIREICDRYGILLILDEVMCGMGRTGTLHAFEQEGIEPDIFVIAKGLAGGYAPMGAVLSSNTVTKAIRDGSGAFVHGHTYNGHPLACAAALEVQRVIRREGLLERVVDLGRTLAQGLSASFADHPFVGDVRGRGLFYAVELVRDRGSKQPFPPDQRLHAVIKEEAMALGLAVYPSGGCMDGRAGDHVLIAPPYVSDRHTIEIIVERLALAVDAAVSRVQASRPGRSHG